jgi:hypothetical protein
LVNEREHHVMLPFFCRRRNSGSVLRRASCFPLRRILKADGHQAVVAALIGAEALTLHAGGLAGGLEAELMPFFL